MIFMVAVNSVKQLSVIFILNHINNLNDHAKILVTTLLLPKSIQSNYFKYYTLARFVVICLVAKAMTLHSVITPYIII